MRISDWSSDVCSSDLAAFSVRTGFGIQRVADLADAQALRDDGHAHGVQRHRPGGLAVHPGIAAHGIDGDARRAAGEFREKEIDENLEARLHPPFSFPRAEDAGIDGSKQMKYRYKRRQKV